MDRSITISSEQSISGKKIFCLSSIPLVIIILAEIFKIFFFDEIRLHFADNQAQLQIYIERVTVFQLFLMPLIGFLSDKFGRKKILIISLLSLSISAILLKMQVHLYLTAFFYSLGAIIPVARAAYCDVHIVNKRVPNIINTFIVQPIPWILFFRLSFIGLNLFIFLISVSLLFVVLVLFLFKDREDDHLSHSSYKFRGIKEAGGVSVFLRIICAFIVSNTIWTVLQYYFEETQPFLLVGQYFSLSQGLAFLFGVLIARFLEIDSKKMFGLISVIISVTTSLQIIVWAIAGYQGNIIPSIFVALTFFGGIGQPLVYSVFGRKTSIHEQGILYGFIESCQLFTEWIGSSSLNHLKMLQNPINILIIVLVGSFISLFLTIGFIRTRWRKST